MATLQPLLDGLIFTCHSTVFGHLHPKFNLVLTVMIINKNLNLLKLEIGLIVDELA